MKDTARSENGSGTACQVLINAARHGRGMACVNYPLDYLLISLLVLQILHTICNLVCCGIS
jgi:hypothetical protein